jgi:hypothetical protein
MKRFSEYEEICSAEGSAGAWNDVIRQCMLHIVSKLSDWLPDEADTHGGRTIIQHFYSKSWLPYGVCS